MRIGLVKYINALPLTQMLRNYTPLYATPQELNSLFAAGKLDLVLSSSVAATDCDSSFLPQFCICAKKEILSVNLYSRLPVEELSGKRIMLDPSSSTSNQLLQILCRDLWKISPHFLTKPTESYEAFLMIGDQALRHRAIAPFQTIDLATSWYEMTGLPFVFALFSHRKNLDTKEIERKIAESLTWSERHLETIIAEAAQKTSLSHEVLAKYYEACHYHLGPDEKRGLEVFQQLRRREHAYV